MNKAFLNRFKIIPFKSDYAIEKDDNEEDWKKYNCKAFHAGQSTPCDGDITNSKLKCSKCDSLICLKCEKLIQNKQYNNNIVCFECNTILYLCKDYLNEIETQTHSKINTTEQKINKAIRTTSHSTLVIPIENNDGLMDSQRKIKFKTLEEVD